MEFALVAGLLFMLLLGVIEMARVLFTWNSAVEATRYGARVAVVCDIDKTPPFTSVVSHMQRIMPQLPANKVNVEYLSQNYSSCNDTSIPCKWVRVSIPNFQLQTYIPFVDTTLNMPSFSTTLPRESLDSAGGSNPTCY